MGVVIPKARAFISTLSPKSQNDSRDITTENTNIHKDKENRRGAEQRTDAKKILESVKKLVVIDLEELKGRNLN